MKKAIIITLALTLAGLFILTGCSDNSASNDAESSFLNMDDFFGGYSPTDEAPAFGDEEISRNFPEPEVVSSELNRFNDLDSIQGEPDVSVYSMRILWGMLEYDPTITSLTDWSGSLTVDTGCIRVINKVLFEPLQDYLVRPRISCRFLEWVSFTSVHYDGIQVFLYFRNSVTDPATTQVVFETGPFSRTFALSELDSLSETVDVDNLGNKVFIEAEKLWRLDCPEGYLEGRWIRSGYQRIYGQFYGRFLSLDGLFLGHVKGHWGVNSEGEKLFFGKWINHLGRFQGFLRGNWGFDASVDEIESAGWFDGNYFSASLRNLGTLNGNWVSHHRGSMPTSGATDKVPKQARGFFHGIWKQYCN
ncbi:MAG: hypothetical protein GWO41_11255 [candidate division Zixibacteria bacterium]|nr:hypothetical protein [candidate division Zixibacteria bacterium]NIR63159.1 hypothetical protein [candidate division Zixibacteria bacterium]NIS16881.1 hypothetical protein [candidate division Zixibacteria bacterium]NIS45144.1 hypothetical protein [candidate division Zixibacteria bacterium]NIT53293.1 hypothetical protein [candidate division Zixibacteria bacterium]